MANSSIMTSLQFVRYYAFAFAVALGASLAGVAGEIDIMYGGAWKGPHAEQNIIDAFSLGYRSFDTANVYPASYNETAVGVALERLRYSHPNSINRNDMFIQTKFTPGVASMEQSACPDGPWDPSTCMFDKNADLATQVKQSVQTSLAHLRISQLNSLVLHETRQPWEDLQIIWRAMEDAYIEGKTASIGVSHAHDPDDFRRLLEFAKIKPSFLQNPVFAYNKWDYDIRMICREHNIAFQAYSLNHGENDFVYETKEVQSIATRLRRTPQQVIVAFVKRLGLIPLVGPQDRIYMAHAITAAKYLPALLTDADMNVLENISSKKNRVKRVDRKSLGLSVENMLTSDIFMAWKHPDHTDERAKHGMHAHPLRIVAGETVQITTHHRHGFYIWDVSEGDQAPLYRQDLSSRRWVRRVSANGFQHGKKIEVVVNKSFQVVLVNMDRFDYTIVLGIEEGAPSETYVVPGGGGSVSLAMVDGQSMEVKLASNDIDQIRSNSWKKTRIVFRRDGDPQLLPLQFGTTATGVDETEKEGDEVFVYAKKDVNLDEL